MSKQARRSRAIGLGSDIAMLLSADINPSVAVAHAETRSPRGSPLIFRGEVGRERLAEPRKDRSRNTLCICVPPGPLRLCVRNVWEESYLHGCPLILTSGVLTGQAACYTITGRRDEVSAPGGGTTAAESRFGMIACASSRRAVTRVEYQFGDPFPTFPSTGCFATVDGKGVACPPLIVCSARHTLAIIVPLDWVP